jgi:hypothetical protein
MSAPHDSNQTAGLRAEIGTPEPPNMLQRPHTIIGDRFVITVVHKVTTPYPYS